MNTEAKYQASEDALVVHLRELRAEAEEAGRIYEEARQKFIRELHATLNERIGATSLYREHFGPLGEIGGWGSRVALRVHTGVDE